ncbi:MAG: hypothetical protein IKM20_05885 [Erysipelotrichales bacterium]|nr:hypothetical protein [Erysipelotrichales bacterium]
MIILHALLSNIDTLCCSVVYGYRRTKMNLVSMLTTSLFVFLSIYFINTLMDDYLMVINTNVASSLSTFIYLMLAYVTYKEYHKKNIANSSNVSDLNHDNVINVVETIYLGIYFSLDNFLLTLPLIFQGYSPIEIATTFGFTTFITLQLGNQIGITLNERYYKAYFMKYAWLLFIILSLIHIYF